MQMISRTVLETFGLRIKWKALDEATAGVLHRRQKPSQTSSGMDDCVRHDTNARTEGEPPGHRSMRLIVPAMTYSWMHNRTRRRLPKQQLHLQDGVAGIIRSPTASSMMMTISNSACWRHLSLKSRTMSKASPYNCEESIGSLSSHLGWNHHVRHPARGMRRGRRPAHT